MWDPVQRPNLRIIGTKEGEEAQLKGAEIIFNKITEENFPNLKKTMPMKVQEAYLLSFNKDQDKQLGWTDVYSEEITHNKCR